MNDKIIKFLNERGYIVNTEPYQIINVCEDWYADNSIPNFHNRINLNRCKVQLEHLNFAKRGCEDEANLCEIVEVNAGEKEDQHKFINDVLYSNDFFNMYRKQLERTCAEGTTACYVRLDNANIYEDGSISGGEIKLNYVNAGAYIPLTIINDEIIEAAFFGEQLIKTKTETTLVVFTKEDNRYIASTYVFDDKFRVIEDKTIESVILGEVKPFAIMKTAQVNNLDNMDGFGLPKIYNAIPVLKGLDLCYNVLFGDLKKSDKLLLVNELMCEFDSTGKPSLTAQQKEVFVMLGEKLPDQNNLVQEYNPTIRSTEIKETFDLLLSLFSQMFGFGSKKYSFDNNVMQTATEYIISHNDAMQSLNKQREESSKYIKDICKALMWFSNTYHGTNWNIDEEILVNFDDSVITDRSSELDSLRNDALSFGLPYLTILYLSEKFNLSMDEAKKIYEQGTTDLDLLPEEGA